MVIRPSLIPSAPNPSSRPSAERVSASPSDQVELGSARPLDGKAMAALQVAALQSARKSAAGPRPDPKGGLFNSLGTLLKATIGAPIIGVALNALHVRPARASAPAQPAPAASPTHAVEVVRRIASEKWGWMELLRDGDPHFKQQNFHPRQTLRDPELLALFGTDRPHSGDVGLLYAGDPPPGVKRHETPVILVHGASKNGQFWQTENDLAERMRNEGYPVYAVSFAHSHDDNNFWAQNVADAIDRVKQLEGVKQVDLVAHSKGGVPARMYTSNFREPWMTAYRGDVRRLALVAAPNGGIDFSFRHPTANLVLSNAGNDPRLNAPMTWDAILTPFGFKDKRNVGFGKDGADYFPGQRQLLARWDKEHPLPVLEQDWYTSYYGGQGFVSQSSGIDHFIEQSGHFMERLQQSRIDPSVQVVLMAGDNPNVQGIVNEYTGKSDGLLFLKSAVKLPTDTNIVAEGILPLNHKSLLSERKGQDWLMNALGADNLKTLTPAQRRKIEANV